MFTLGVLTACNFEKYEPIQLRTFPEKNKTEYVFHKGLNICRDTILNIFKDFRQLDDKGLNHIFYHNTDIEPIPITFTPEISDSIHLFSAKYFESPNTKNDIYLQNWGEFWPSRLYHSNGKSLEYNATFVIKFSSVDSNHTKVQVNTINPKVINGYDGWGAHGPNLKARITPVPSTSIEEYALLRYIGKYLGDTTLPSIKLPVN